MTHQKLVIKAFEKVKLLEKNESGIPMSINKTATKLSDILLEDYKTSYSYKSLEKVFKGIDDIKKPHILLSICKFLEFENYQDFLQENKLVDIQTTDFGAIDNPEDNSNKTEGDQNNASPEKDILIFIKENKIIICLIIILLLGLAIYFSTKQRWMIWAEDHYIEVNFNPKKYELGQLKLYKEERITSFKKIKLNCDYEFFDKEGKPKIWYDKNSIGELELFTALGLHPETKKTLKPITSYIIRKYICK